MGDDRDDSRMGHEPKLSALRALASDTLSAEGRGRLERHLAMCASCRQAQLGMERFDSLAAAAGVTAQQDTPPLRFSGVDGMITREARTLAGGRGTGWAPTLALVAAAAAVIAVATRDAGPPPEVEVAIPDPSPAAAPVVAESARVAVRFTLLSGDVSVELAGQPPGPAQPATMEMALQEGTTVVTAAGAEAHVVVNGLAALRVASDTRVSVGTARVDRVELQLISGRLEQQVAPLGLARYRVVADEHVVEVRGTRFGVASTGSVPQVRLDEGHVIIIGPDGRLLADLRAPASFPRSGALQFPDPVATPLAAAGAWPVLTLPAFEPVVGWELGGRGLPANAELAMRAPPGEHELVALLADGMRVRHTLALDPLGTRFDPRDLSLPRRRAVRTQPGTLDSGAASSALRAARPALQRCYERALKLRPELSPQLHLRLRIDGKGRVSRAYLAGAADDLPARLTRCIREVAAELEFPPPGGAGVLFEAPLSFHQR